MQNSCLWITRWSVSSAVLTKFPIFTENYAVRKSCALPLPHHTASGRGRENSPVEKRPGYKKIIIIISPPVKQIPKESTPQPHKTKGYLTPRQRLTGAAVTSRRANETETGALKNPPASHPQPRRAGGLSLPGHLPWGRGRGGQAASTADGSGTVSWSQPQGGLWWNRNLPGNGPSRLTSLSPTAAPPGGQQVPASPWEESRYPAPRGGEQPAPRTLPPSGPGGWDGAPSRPSPLPSPAVTRPPSRNKAPFTPRRRRAAETRRSGSQASAGEGGLTWLPPRSEVTAGGDGPPALGWGRRGYGEGVPGRWGKGDPKSWGRKAVAGAGRRLRGLLGWGGGVLPEGGGGSRWLSVARGRREGSLWGEGLVRLSPALRSCPVKPSCCPWTQPFP